MSFLSSSLPPILHPAVFLDRDDTLIANRAVTAATPHPGDLCSPALVSLLPTVARGLFLLKAAGFRLVVVSNQGCVARGVCSIPDVNACNDRLRELLLHEANVVLDAIYFCPHHPAGSVSPYNVEHPWRKPSPGMILAAAADLSLDLSRSWMIGDAPRDIDSAARAGIHPARCLLLSDQLSFTDAVARILSALSA